MARHPLEKQKVRRLVPLLSVKAIVDKQTGAKANASAERRDINDLTSGPEVLSDQMIFKLQQIVDFCESFAMDEQKQIEHFTLQESKLLAKQRIEEEVLR